MICVPLLRKWPLLLVLNLIKWRINENKEIKIKKNIKKISLSSIVLRKFHAKNGFPIKKKKRVKDLKLIIKETQLAFTYSKLTTETLEQGVKYVQSYQ